MNILELLLNINFLSANLGFLGSLLLFFFGLPPKLDIDGYQHLILEQIDKDEKRKAKLYRVLGNIGIILITICFLLQVITIVSNE